MKAPTRNRRPGFSRRAQYGLFISYVVAVTGILVGLGLIVIAHVDPDGFGAVRGAALDATAPVSTLERGMVRDTGSLVDGVAAYIAAGSQNAAMTRELDVDRRALVHLRIIALENDRLRKMLNVTPLMIEATLKQCVEDRVPDFRSRHRSASDRSIKRA